MTETFNPGDTVNAKLWPELGTGEVLRLTKAETDGARVAEVHWPDAQQTSRHSVLALKHADQEVPA